MDLFYGLQKWFDIFYSWFRAEEVWYQIWYPQKDPLDTLSETLSERVCGIGVVYHPLHVDYP